MDKLKKLLVFFNASLCEVNFVDTKKVLYYDFELKKKYRNSVKSNLQCFVIY